MVFFFSLTSFFVALHRGPAPTCVLDRGLALRPSRGGSGAGAGAILSGLSDLQRVDVPARAPLKFPEPRLLSGLDFNDITSHALNAHSRLQATPHTTTPYPRSVSPRDRASDKEMATSSVALPGQLLGPASKYRPGPGVHLHEANLYSSLLGAVSISQPGTSSSSSSSTSTPTAIRGPPKRQNKLSAALQQQQQPHHATGGGELPTISVSRGAAGGGRRQREVLPQVGNAVLCRVTRITPRQAVVAILVCGETVLEAEWQGVIRVQDVRATEKDRVKIYESFRPGDIVRASVVRI